MSDHRALLLAERASPSALDLGPTLPESNQRDVEGPHCMRFGKTGAARLGIAFARRMVLPCQRSVRGRVRSVRGPAFLAPRQPADPNSDSSLALRRGALVVDLRRPSRGKPGEASRLAILDAALDAHHTSIEVVAISAVVRHGGPNPTLMRDTLLAVIMIIMNGMVGVTLLIGGVKHREQSSICKGPRPTSASCCLSRPSP